MATQLQIRRGTTAENEVFTGAQGELTMDTDTNGVRIHDGTTVGGFDVPTAATADYVVEWQAPTDLNNYTWYRKYKSGWVEQGGEITTSGEVTLPVEMSDTHYTVTQGIKYMVSATWTIGSIRPVSTTTISVNKANGDASWWQVSGMSAS